MFNARHHARLRGGFLAAAAVVGSIALAPWFLAEPAIAQPSRPDSSKPKLPGQPLAPSPANTVQAGKPDSGSAPIPAANTPQNLAPVSPSGKSLIIPDALKAKGTPYYSQPGGAWQVSFLSDAPFEKITGHSNAVIGFAIAGPASDPAKLQGGEWRLPVSSLRTGNSDRDGHLASPEWLDAARHPHVIFQLKDVRDAKEQTGGKDTSMRSYGVTLIGDMTIHGVTKELTIPALVRFRPRSSHSSVYAEGDFLMISCKHSITLSDFGVRHPQITDKKKVANTIEIDTRLLLATIPPEEQPEPSIKPVREDEAKKTEPAKK